MALEAGGQRFCKVVHSENGRTSTRRIHTMTVQAADGQIASSGWPESSRFDFAVFGRLLSRCALGRSAVEP